MALGLGFLRLAPKDFWMMTPRELERALSFFLPDAEGFGREQLGALMRAFPDMERVDG
ncbi:MAG: phage tail assembly chaperone [Methylobacterium mesophilicum]|nr:phage tail assembly chaperone [Methylobacterium mesophilicum]